MFACLSIRRHAEANCVKKHAKIDDFSSKFEEKLNHEKSKMWRLMDRNNTSRRLVYRNRVDMQNKERGARVAQIYADKVQVSFLTFKGRILRVRILAHIFMEHKFMVYKL